MSVQRFYKLELKVKTDGVTINGEFTVQSNPKAVPCPWCEMLEGQNAICSACHEFLDHLREGANVAAELAAILYPAIAAARKEGLLPTSTTLIKMVRGKSVKGIDPKNPEHFTKYTDWNFSKDMAAFCVMAWFVPSDPGKNNGLCKRIVPGFGLRMGRWNKSPGKRDPHWVDSMLMSQAFLAASHKMQEVECNMGTLLDMVQGFLIHEGHLPDELPEAVKP